MLPLISEDESTTVNGSVKSPLSVWSDSKNKGFHCIMPSCLLLNAHSPTEEAEPGREGQTMCLVISKWEIHHVTTQSLWFLKTTQYWQPEWEFTTLFQI